MTGTFQVILFCNSFTENDVEVWKLNESFHEDNQIAWSSLTIIVDQYSTNDRSAAAPQPVVYALQYALCRGALVCGRGLCYVGATGGPDRSVCQT